MTYVRMQIHSHSQICLMLLDVQIIYQLALLPYNMTQFCLLNFIDAQYLSTTNTEVPLIFSLPVHVVPCYRGRDIVENVFRNKMTLKECNSSKLRQIFVFRTS